VSVESQQVWTADDDHVGLVFIGWLPFIHMSPSCIMRLLQSNGASFYICEPGEGFGCDSLRVIEDPIPLA
jgi:hypothetical protein